MKKSILIAAVFCSLSSLSCQKEVKEVMPEVTLSKGPTSFVVSLPETRTVLEDHSVLWADNDEIRVFGYTAGEPVESSAVFQFTGTNEEGLSVFSIKDGETLGDYDTYYAAYPAMTGVSLNVSGGSASMVFPRLNSFPYNVRNQRPSDGGFDPNLAIMTAKYDGEHLVFRHGVGYVKLTVPYDGVTSIDISFGNNCVGDTPTFNLEAGTLASLANSSNHVTASVSFVKGQSYFIAAVPRPGYSIGTTTVSYTTENGAVSVSTDHFKGKNVEIGKIFDLGSPTKPTSPRITFIAPAKLDYDATSGSFAYAVENPVSGQAVTATLESGVDWISNIVVGADAVTFACEPNDAADAEERTAVITLSYEGAEDCPVLIKQGADNAAAKETHHWNFSEFTADQMQTITGLEADAKATAGQTWDFGDGLTMVTNGSSKWNVGTIDGVEYKWVATGGKYGSNQKFFSFTTESVGTVTVVYASGKNDTPRSLSVNAGGSVTTDSDNVSSGTKDLKTVTFPSVAAGTVMLYSTIDNILVFSIDFVED